MFSPHRNTRADRWPHARNVLPRAAIRARNVRRARGMFSARRNVRAGRWPRARNVLPTSQSRADRCPRARNAWVAEKSHFQHSVEISFFNILAGQKFAFFQHTKNELFSTWNVPFKEASPSLEEMLEKLNLIGKMLKKGENMLKKYLYWGGSYLTNFLASQLPPKLKPPS